jgi:hypothetical protein
VIWGSRSFEIRNAAGSGAGEVLKRARAGSIAGAGSSGTSAANLPAGAGLLATGDRSRALNGPAGSGPDAAPGLG